MTETAIFDTTEMLRTRIGQAIGLANQVHVGPPLRNEIGEARVSLFLFHMEVNAELRNQQRLLAPPPMAPATQAGIPVDALPWDLRFLITVFRTPDNSVIPPNELVSLGQVIQEFHARPTLTGAALNEQVVRITPEPYPMEELSRVWGLFPQDVYRTSVVYLVSPVFIEVGPETIGQPVQRREQRAGVDVDAPNLGDNIEGGSNALL